MSITTRVPFNVDVNPSLPGYPPGALVGGDTAMQTSDGDTSYAEVYAVWLDASILSHTFEWSPAGAIPAGATVTIEADWWTDTEGGFSLSAQHPTFGGSTIINFRPPTGETTHDYGHVDTATVPSFWVTDGAVFLPGVVWEVVPLAPGVFLGDASARITRLTLVIETAGEEPLRLMQRSDGLGMGSGRVLGVGTRQASTRVFGPL